MEEIVNAANRAWSRGNETLFDHVLDYERKLNGVPGQSWKVDP